MGSASDGNGNGSLHDQVVCEIAANRFGLDEWTVFTRAAENGDSVADIVATHRQEVVAIGEVETGAICDERARRWKSLGESCVRFYLYVPEGLERKAAELIVKHGVSCAGLRSYKLNGKLEVKSVHIEDAMFKSDDHPWWLALGGGSITC